MNDNLLEAFGLTTQQARLMFSLQAAIAEHDYDLDKTPIPDKIRWVSKWKSELRKSMNSEDKSLIEKDKFLEDKSLIEDDKSLIEKALLCKELQREVDRHENKTWFYILILECITFQPFTPLEEKDIKEKTYSKCKFNREKGYDYLKSILIDTNRISAERGLKNKLCKRE